MIGTNKAPHLTKRCGALLLAVLLSACGPTREFERSPEHLDAPSAEPEAIPELVEQAPVLTPPEIRPPEENYTVVVTDVPVRELLFALSRDALLNVDVHGDVEGNVTINAVEQTLPQILERISKQVRLRYTIDGSTLSVMPDLPFWRTYRLDYVNIDRESSGEVTVSTKMSTTGGGISYQTEGTGGGGDDDTGNQSKTVVKSGTNNNFWELITQNVRQLVASDRSPGQGETNPDDTVVANAMNGIISVYANQYQQKQIQLFLDYVSANARRQVLIEATIVEVELNDNYQAGVDWARVAENGGQGDGLSLVSQLIGNNLSTPPVFAMNYQNTSSDGSGITATVKLLEQFGDATVLSSPRIMALNNQTAMLKVVDEVVYFSLEQEIREAAFDRPERTLITSEIHTVPVGFVMTVTPQINENDNVSLNVRPTITRIVDFAVDPAPRLAGADFDNLVPEIHVSEIESLLEVANGQTVMIGGLMQDRTINKQDGIPGLSAIPGIGKLFTYRNDEIGKSELVIFLRPTVIKGAGANNGRSAVTQFNSGGRPPGMGSRTYSPSGDSQGGGSSDHLAAARKMVEEENVR
ncbi:MAG: pilus (MSHA type) biogenesis protein MshL [Gammaproteobacteria bacterium]